MTWTGALADPLEPVTITFQRTRSMMRTCRLLLLLAAVCSLAARPGFATSYVMVADPDLAAQATAVVDAKVVSVEPASAAGRPATDYTVEIERLLSGSAPGTTLIVRVPGGTRADGIGFYVYGAPRFAVGERALLFLAPRNDGTFGILHLGLGAFHRVDVAGAPPLAVRDLSGADEIVPPGAAPDPRRHLARDFDAFAGWLSDRGAGIESEADYYVEPPAPVASSIRGKFTLFEIGGLNLRWFEFDSGGSVGWSASSRGQTNVPGGGFGEFQQALRAWTNEASTPIRLGYQGQTSASGGLDQFDNFNVLLQGDPNNEISGTFQCGAGGVLAIGGPWFDSDDRRPFQGKQYVAIARADIVMNDGIECLSNFSSCYPVQIGEVYGHELGHTLGLGHSCGDNSSPGCGSNPTLNDALMRASAHSDCRGPRLGVDDIQGIRALYGSSGGGGGRPRGPAAPTGLEGSLEPGFARLRWLDASIDETGFRIYRSTNGAPLVTIAELSSGVSVFFDDDIAPATQYQYRVAAFNDKGESARSNPLEITVPPASPVAVGLALAPAAEVRVGEPVTFLAKFSGPAEEAEWSFGAGDVGFNDTRCAADTFCRSHVFDTSGPRTVEVTLTGPFGQVAHDTLMVQVEDAPFPTVAEDSFLQWTIFGRRGDTGTFESNVWLHNAGGLPARVELSYLPRGLEAPPAPRTLTLAPAESLFLPNVLETLFGVSAGQGSVALHAEQEEVAGESGPRVFAVSRSFVGPDNRAEGSFGLFVPEQGKAAWTPDPKVVTGILEGDGFLSTLLGVNVDDSPGRVEIDLFDRHGDPVGGQAILSLGPGVMRFRPTADLFPEVGDHDGPFTARFSSNGIRFLASSTLLETGSEDQIFLPAREPEASAELIVPRVVRSPGQFGVFLTTSLAVLSQAPVPTQVTFQLLLRGQNNIAPLEATRTVPAGGLLFLGDVIDDLFGLETATGALRVLWNGGPDLAPRVVALTSSETAQGNRFGMAIEARTPADAMAAVGVDFGVEQSDLFRSQYGAVNLAPEGTKLRLTLRDANGTELAQTDVALKARQHLELNLATLFGPVAETGANWSVTTEVLSGGPVMTYLANINTSGDVFFVPGRARTEVIEVPGG
jgi:hypothetical protein